MHRFITAIFAKADPVEPAAVDIFGAGKEALRIVVVLHTSIAADALAPIRTGAGAAIDHEVHRVKAELVGKTIGVGIACR